MCLLLRITRSWPPRARSGGRPGTATVKPAGLPAWVAARDTDGRNNPDTEEAARSGWSAFDLTRTPGLAGWRILAARIRDGDGIDVTVCTRWRPASLQVPRCGTGRMRPGPLRPRAPGSTARGRGDGGAWPCSAAAGLDRGPRRNTLPRLGGLCMFLAMSEMAAAVVVAADGRMLFAAVPCPGRSRARARSGAETAGTESWR
jgi:hypothetical protein